MTPCCSPISYIAVFCWFCSAFISKAIGAEAKLSIDDFKSFQPEINNGHNSKPSLNLRQFDNSIKDQLADTSVTDFVEMIAVAIADNHLPPSDPPSAKSEFKPRWEEIFATSHQYHLIESSTSDGLTFVTLSKTDLAGFIALDEISRTAKGGYATHNIFGTDYVIWPYSEGRHELGQVLHWPLQAIIGFHNRVEEYNGVMQLSTNDYRAHVQFTNCASEINLSFTASEFITAPVFMTTARLEIGDGIYEADILIAQIFGNGHNAAPLFGQFVTIAPDALAPHYGVFESQ